MISRCVWQRGGVTIDPFSFSQLNGKREVKKEYLMWSAPSVLEPLLCWLYSNGSSMLMPTSPERGFHHVSSVWWREKARPSSLLPSSIYKPDGVHVLQSARKSSQITTKKNDRNDLFRFNVHMNRPIYRHTCFLSSRRRFHFGFVLFSSPSKSKNPREGRIMNWLFFSSSYSACSPLERRQLDMGL